MNRRKKSRRRPCVNRFYAFISHRTTTVRLRLGRNGRMALRMSERVGGGGTNQIVQSMGQFRGKVHQSFVAFDNNFVADRQKLPTPTIYSRAKIVEPVFVSPRGLRRNRVIRVLNERRSCSTQQETVADGSFENTIVNKQRGRRRRSGWTNN